MKHPLMVHPHLMEMKNTEQRRNLYKCRENVYKYPYLHLTCEMYFSTRLEVYIMVYTFIGRYHRYVLHGHRGCINCIEHCTVSS